MASKSLLIALASFLLLTTQGSTLAGTGNANYKTPPPPPAAAPPPPPAKSPYPPPATPPAKAAPPPPYPPPPVQPPRNRQECVPLCTVRCAKHSRQNICMRACLACCERCKCVPPGQYGNRDKCGKCYASMTTHRGLLKCP